MQIKITIGIIAFMLTTMIFSFVALREPARLARYSAAIDGRTIENGGLLFKDNCVSCHGINGQAKEGCTLLDENGVNTEICQGLPLNSPALLCGDVSQRMVAMNSALSKEAFIRSTISAGRGQIMPAWSADFGGPKLDHEIDQLTAFVLNWQPTDAACDIWITEQNAVDWAKDYPSVADLPEGDPVAGIEAFATCKACHGDPKGAASTATTGPWQGDIATDGATRIDGYTAADYIYESILNPNAYITAECPTGACAPGVMPGNFGQILSEQDMADILAYLLDTTTFESTATIQMLETTE